jgi:hypothetical protein
VSVYAPGESLEDIVSFVHEATRRQVELSEQLNAFHRSGNGAGAATVSAQIKRLVCDIHSALNTLEDLARQGKWLADAGPPDPVTAR